MVRNDNKPLLHFILCDTHRRALAHAAHPRRATHSMDTYAASFCSQLPPNPPLGKCVTRAPPPPVRCPHPPRPPRLSRTPANAPPLRGPPGPTVRKKSTFKSQPVDISRPEPQQRAHGREAVCQAPKRQRPLRKDNTPSGRIERRVHLVRGGGAHRARALGHLVVVERVAEALLVTPVRAPRGEGSGIPRPHPPPQSPDTAPPPPPL